MSCICLFTESETISDWPGPFNDRNQFVSQVHWLIPISPGRFRKLTPKNMKVPFLGAMNDVSSEVLKMLMGALCLNPGYVALAVHVASITCKTEVQTILLGVAPINYIG